MWWTRFPPPFGLNSLVQRYDLRLTHFQSHYLPSGWETRVRHLDRFGRLDVFIVDAMDITLGKLFSRREKDRYDLRVLATKSDRTELVERPGRDTQRFLADPQLRANAEQNWYILFGEPLPA
jgi:hypothetical protein